MLGLTLSVRSPPDAAVRAFRVIESVRTLAASTKTGGIGELSACEVPRIELFGGGPTLLLPEAPTPPERLERDEEVAETIAPCRLLNASTSEGSFTPSLPPGFLVSIWFCAACPSRDSCT